MRLVSKFLLALLCAFAVTFGAKAYDLTVTVNNPELVNVLINYSQQTLTGETTTFKNLSGFNYVMVTTNDAVIQRVVKNGVAEDNPTFVEMNMNDDYGIETFTLDITVTSLADMPKKSFTAVIDNPARVEMTLQPKYQIVTGLVAGDNTIEYIPESMTYVSIAAPWGEAPIYKVESTGTSAPRQYSEGDWEVQLEEGIVITVMADYPDESVPVKFNFSNDGRECISSIKVDGNEVADFDPENFNVKLGSKLSITLNKEDFVLNTFMYNNYDPYMGYTDTYSTFVTAPATVTLDAVKNKMVSFTVNVNIGAGVELCRGEYIDSSRIISLNDGENNVEVNAASPALSLVAADGYEIDEVKLNGQKVEYDALSGKYALTVREGDQLEIKVTAIVRDQKVALYLTDMDMWSNFNFTVGNSTVRNLTNGYNILEYAASELSSVGLNANSWYYDTSDAQLYVNDILKSPEYVGTFQFAFGLEGGDVVKVFFKGAPTKYYLTFDISTGVELTDVTHDVVAPFDPADGLECFEGTEVSFNAKNAVVKANGVELTPDDAQNYLFTVDRDMAIEVKSTEASVDQLQVEDEVSREIYNLQGIRVTNDSSLPSGIYIVNGKKVKL